MNPFFYLLSGSLFPYCFSWIIYQGHLVTDLLNWAGLVVNGLIAFVFPIALCYFVFVVKPAQVISSDDRLTEEALEMSELGEEREIKITLSPRSNGSTLEIPSQKALFPWLLPYRSAIISIIFVLFLTMITTTIIVNLLYLL